MADPVRLYNPNPDAPNVWGAAPTKRSPLAEVLASVPSPYDVFTPPAEARKSYGSLARAMVDATAPAAVRDTVDASGQTMGALSQGRGWDAAGGVANMLTAAAGIVPGGRLITKGAKELAQPIRAYHGSPHDFDKFDLSKIGTGEGAQAYGHGLYFAENEKVAKGYRDSIGSRSYRSSPDPAKQAFDAIQYHGSRDAALAALRESNTDFARHQIAAIESGMVDRLVPGKMYEVNIHADPAKFLDWDKPLSGQSAPVRNALSSIPLSNLDETGGQIYRNYLPDIRYSVRQGDSFAPSDAKTFQEALDAAGGNPANLKRIHNYSQPAASQQLSDLGIPGIKYLDGGSRAAGDGSRNYVAFDDKTIEILRKYGFLPVAAGGAALATSQPDEGNY